MLRLRAQSLIEYAILVATIVVIVVIAVAALGGSISTLLQKFTGSIATA